MTTSGSVNYALTTNQIIDEAFAICGVASEGEAVSADQYFQATRTLNMMVKAWSASDHIWLRTEAAVTPVAAQAPYALATLFTKRPLRVLSVRRRLTSGTLDTPLRELSREEYEALPNKAVTGIPTAFFYDPQRATGTLYVWPAPDATFATDQTLRVTYLRPIEDFDETNNDPDLPQEWLLVLSYGLADHLGVKYGVKADLRQEIAARAALYKAQIDAWDSEPASLYMQPEHYG